MFEDTNYVSPPHHACCHRYQASELDVLVGKYTRDADPNEARRQVTEIRRHPQYVPHSYLNDVALLR